MASDVIRVRLHLRQIRVLEVDVDTPEELRVRVESTVSRPRCPHCGFKCHKVHDTREREVRDLEVSGRRTVLVWLRHRFSCGNCGERFLEDHLEFDGRMTRRLAHRLVADAQVMTIRTVARRHGVSWPVINTLVRAWSGLIAEHRRSRRCSVLLVDETSMRKRHRYVTVIVNADTNKTLAMIEHRSSAALSAFLMSQPHRWRRGVKVVVTDGSTAYKTSVETCLPHARQVLDRFHVIRWFTAGLTAVRRDIQRRPEGSKPAFDPEVFKARFTLLRRGDTLTNEDRARLDALFDTHPRLRAGWQALQELHGLYLADDHEGALKALDRFCDLYQTGELPEFHDIVNTIINWSDQILAWHHTNHPSNGRIEGTIIWSVSEGVVDVADGYVAGCGGRVIWSMSSRSAMLLCELDRASFGLALPVGMLRRWPMRVQTSPGPGSTASSICEPRSTDSAELPQPKLSPFHHLNEDKPNRYDNDSKPPSTKSPDSKPTTTTLREH